MRRVALLATVLLTLVPLTGCGSDEPPGEGSGPAATRIELSLEGGDAPPTERVEVEPGAEIELVITADEPGELHVHSTPGQTIEYTSGTTTEIITIDQPGVIDVERHEPEALVLQLQVS